MFGKIYSPEMRAKISEALTGKVLSETTKENISKAHTGKFLSEETKLKISETLSGKILIEATRAKIREVNTGKILSEETKEKMSKTLGTTIYLYSSDKSSLINTFNSYRKAAEHFNVDKGTILRYTKSGKLFKEQWVLCSSSISKK